MEATEKLKIAFATNNQTDLNEHFGSCQQLSIYSLSPAHSEHVKSVNFIAQDGHNQQKINDRLQALQDCFAVYCLACGNPVRQQLMANGIRVVVHPQTELIDSLISQIQTNWPGKIAQRQQQQANKKEDNDYFASLADSEWDVEN
jgi:nitrogen fixation protein NifX